MFMVFVLLTLCITWWAARRIRSTADFYSADGGILGWQNGLALAGDYMSASTLLGITALIYTSGMDGYIYLIAFFAGWPVLLLLMTERLRNLGRFTFADITSYRLDQAKVRTMAAIGSLTVVCFYLVAQMVGAGQLIRLLFGLDYHIALIIVGALMMLYVTFGGMVATTWVQIIKALLLLGGGSLVLFLAMREFDFSYDNLVTHAKDTHALGERLLAPGSLLSDPLTALSLSLGLVFGTAGLPHILMRFFTVSDAREARKFIFSKLVWVDLLHFAEPLFPYTQPALFSMPLAFLVANGVSSLDRTARAEAERAAFADQFVRGQTGLGASGAVGH